MDGKEDNKDIVLLDPKLFVSTVELVTLNEYILSRVRAKAGLLEDLVTKGLSTSSPEWGKDGDLVYREGHICIPKDGTLQGDIIRSHHNTPIARHPDQFKTYELITRNYWWPGLQRDVNWYVPGCEACQ